MSFDTLLDALPYTDVGYDEPGAKQTVVSLIEEEIRRYKPTKNYLEFKSMFFSQKLNKPKTPTLKKEFDRMEQRLPMEMLSMKRYELPPPPPNKMNDPSAWLECVENSSAQLEHQETRIVNLELMAEYGSNSWKLYNQTLKTMQDQAEKHLEEIKKGIQAINFNRKNEQTVAGAQIKSLEQKWIGLVSKNYEIECAIVELEKELAELRKKRDGATTTVAASETTQPTADEDSQMAQETQPN